MTRDEKIKGLYSLKEYLVENPIELEGHKSLPITLIDYAIEALEQEPCEDTISRKSIKQKLQEHHDFFVNAYGGFSNLPQNDKSRVDEIINCIAMVVNEPSVTPQEPRKGHWISHREHCENLGVIPSGLGAYEWCSNCDCGIDVREWHRNHYNYCPNCGSDNREVKV